jgi:hypothetical protein
VTAPIAASGAQAYFTQIDARDAEYGVVSNGIVEKITRAGSATFSGNSWGFVTRVTLAYLASPR